MNFETFDSWLYNKLFELSENSTLYHRSMKKMKVGDVIKPKLDKQGKHWLENEMFEQALETYREKNFPEAPQRFKCIYCSVIPRSRFKDKGYLYVVKPVGKMLMTDSRLIDEMARNFDDNVFKYIERFSDYSKAREEIKNNKEELLWNLDQYRAQLYWKGIYNRRDKEAIEVLCDSAVVTEVIENKEGDLIRGQNYIVSEDNKVYITFTIYLEQEHVEAVKNKDKNILNIIDKIKNLFIDPQEKISFYEYISGGGNVEIKGYLKKDTKLQVIFANSSMRERKRYGEDDFEGRNNYKYTRINFKPFLDNKYLNDIKINNLKPMQYKMDYFYLYSEKIKDVAKYLKSI